MGRPRTRSPSAMPDRISGHALGSWLRANNVSVHTLARYLDVKYATINGWIAGYRPAPGWLERRINESADYHGRFPRWGEYREAEPLPATDDVLSALELSTPMPGEPEALLYDPRYDWDDADDGDDLSLPSGWITHL
jgi:hypothetical protein